jgi:hypothetical protein
MGKTKLGIILILTLLASSVAGYTLSGLIRNQQKWPIAQKPTVQTAGWERRVQGDTAVVWEKEYVRSQKMQISEFPEREEILGKTLTDVKKIYPADQGFQVSWDGKTLLIHQTIDDWMAEDKQKLRFKVFQDRVSVYQGPDSEHDTLLKVTGLFLRACGADPARYHEGRYEFNNESS